MASGRLGIPTNKVSENTELRLIKENLDKSRQLEDAKKDASFAQLTLERELRDEKLATKTQSRK